MTLRRTCPVFLTRSISRLTATTRWTCNFSEVPPVCKSVIGFIEPEKETYALRLRPPVLQCQSWGSLSTFTSFCERMAVREWRRRIWTDAGDRFSYKRSEEKQWNGIWIGNEGGYGSSAGQAEYVNRKAKQGTARERNRVAADRESHESSPFPGRRSRTPSQPR